MSCTLRPRQRSKQVVSYDLLVRIHVNELDTLTDKRYFAH